MAGTDDSLMLALGPYEGKDVVVEFPGYRARVRVNVLTESDETESGFGERLVEVHEVLEDSPESRCHGAQILILSLDPNADTPLRVITLEGEIIWQQADDQASQESGGKA